MLKYEMSNALSIFRTPRMCLLLIAVLIVEFEVPTPAQGDPSFAESALDGRVVAGQIGGDGIRDVLGALTRYEGPVPGALSTLSRIHLAPNETLYCLVRGGAYVLSADSALLAELHTEPAGSAIGSRRALLQQASRVDVGSGSVFDLNDNESDLIRRDLSWSTLYFGGTWWTWIVERMTPVESIPGQPLAGRWSGAYSYASSKLNGRGDVTQGKEAGTLSAIVLQDGPRCLVRIASRDWHFSGSGLVVDSEFSVGQSSTDGARVFHAAYTPEDDRIRGEIYIATSDEASVTTIFLQRTVPE